MTIKLTKVSDRKYTHGRYVITKGTIAGHSVWHISNECTRITTKPDLNAVRAWIKRREEASGLLNLDRPADRSTASARLG